MGNAALAGWPALGWQPSNADAHELLGRILAETRLCEHVRRHLTTALTLEPDHVLGRFALTRLHELGGRHDEAEVEQAYLITP